MKGRPVTHDTGHFSIRRREERGTGGMTIGVRWTVIHSASGARVGRFKGLSPTFRMVEVIDAIEEPWLRSEDRQEAHRGFSAALLRYRGEVQDPVPIGDALLKCSCHRCGGTRDGYCTERDLEEQSLADIQASNHYVKGK